MKLLRNMSRMTSLKVRQNGWTELLEINTSLYSKIGRDTQFFRLILGDAIAIQRKDFKEVNRQPFTLDMNVFHSEKLKRIVIVLIYTVSGTGSLKLMTKFIENNVSGATYFVMMIYQAPGVHEIFYDVSSLFDALNKNK